MLVVVHAGQMHYDQVADALQRCSKVKAKAKRWVEAAQLLTSEHPQHCMAQEREQPGITELQVRVVCVCTCTPIYVRRSAKHL
jgi:hypothetical protein